MSWVEEEFKNINLGDERLNKRFLATASLLADSPCGTVNQSIMTPKDKKAAYRLFSNSSFDSCHVMQLHAEQTKSRIKNEKVILSVHDTTYLSYTGKKSIKGLGNIGGKSKSGDTYEGDGYIFHAGMAVSEDGVPLGLQSFITWSRDKQDTWDVESDRWVDSFYDAKLLCNDSTQMIYVADREADQYKIIKEIIDNKGHFVIRSRFDRMVHGSSYYLDWDIKTSGRYDRSSYYCPYEKENIEVEVRYNNFSFNDPKVNRSRHLLRKDIDYVSLNYVEIQQIGKDNRWVLLTNLELNSVDDCMRVMKYYRQRWQIEEYFKVLKGGGCQVEKSNLRTYERLVNYLSVIAVVSWKMYYYLMLSRKTPEEPAKNCFKINELEALSLHFYKNWSDKIFMQTLKEIIKMIAELGGHGRYSKNDPGLKSLYRGFVKLEIKAETIGDVKVSMGLESQKRYIQN
jgi:hypothetical protein